MRSFTYERARTPAEAAATASRRPGARFIAGGTNLLDLMKLEIEAPTHLIDVNGLALDKIELTPDGGLRIGALVRNTDLAADARVRRDYGVLSRALLAGASDIEKAFDLSDAGDKDGLAWVEAKPREKEAGFERVKLGLGVSGVEAMELVDHFGQTTKLRFTSIQRNPKLDASEFRFTPPKGADVLGEK